MLLFSFYSHPLFVSDNNIQVLIELMVSIEGLLLWLISCYVCILYIIQYGTKIDPLCTGEQILNEDSVVIISYSSLNSLQY